MLSISTSTLWGATSIRWAWREARGATQAFIYVTRTFWIVLLLGVFFPIPALGAAGRAAETPPRPRSLADLVEGAAAYDGKRVTVEGEVVGDVMIRGSLAWINIGDGSTTIGVWGRTDLMHQVRLTGNYKTRGDLVKVTGVFRRADPNQGGELDIEATTISVAACGKKVAHPVAPAHVARAVLSVMVAALLGMMARLVLWKEETREVGDGRKP